MLSLGPCIVSNCRLVMKLGYMFLAQVSPAGIIMVPVLGFDENRTYT